MTNTTSTDVLQNLSSLHFNMSSNLDPFRNFSILNKCPAFSNGTFLYLSMPNLESRGPIVLNQTKQLASEFFSQLLSAGQSFFQGALSYLQACWNTVTTFASENPSAFMVVICSAAMLLTTMSIFVIAGSKIKNLKQDLQNANKNIQALQDEVKNEQEKNANLQNQVETTKQDLTSANEQIKSLEGQAAQDRNLIENLKEEVAKKEGKIQDQEKELGNKEKQINGLKGTITILTQTFTSTGEMSPTQQLIGEQQTTINDLRNKTENQENKIEELNKKVANLEQELANKNGNK